MQKRIQKRGEQVRRSADTQPNILYNKRKQGNKYAGTQRNR